MIVTSWPKLASRIVGYEVKSGSLEVDDVRSFVEANCSDLREPRGKNRWAFDVGAIATRFWSMATEAHPRWYRTFPPRRAPMTTGPRNVVEPVSDLKLRIVRDLVQKALADGPSSRAARILQHLIGPHEVLELIARIDQRERPQ